MSASPTPGIPLPRGDDHLFQAAKKLLASVLGVHGKLELLAVPRAGSHGTGSLWLCGPNLVLKATPRGKHAAESLGHAWNLLEACRGLSGVPCQRHPKPAWDLENHFWTLLEWLPGESWDPWTGDSRARARKARALLETIHGQSGKALGSGSGKLPCVRLRRGLAASLPGWLRGIRSVENAPGFVASLAERLEARVREFSTLSRRLPDTGPLMVVHGDARPANFIVGPDGELGLTDFNNARMDHPSSDLARLLAGVPGAPCGDALTTDLTRTNRWGSMARWLGRWLETRVAEPGWEARMNELVRLDSLDR